MPEIDTSKAHPVRVYDYLLGGKDHFEADRSPRAEAGAVAHWRGIPTDR
jgi:hypothetical protein